jgi:glyoxylase-like metal-dependent hydrolase (beta-lactamase superfamily II)
MQTINYPFGEAMPPIGEALEIASGVKWIRMPLPFALDHINLWLIKDCFEGQQGWTLVDCGVANQDTQDAWERVFLSALEGMPIVRVIVTHMHPDHIGLAAWLTERWHAPLWMTMTDYVLAKWLVSPSGSDLGSQAGGGGAADHFSRHGLNDAADLEKIRARSSYYSQMVPSVPAQFRRIMDGERLSIGSRSWEVVVGHGHAPEHASLWCEDLEIFISGDMVLPRISTNVSVFDSEPDANPLALYLNSLDQLSHFPQLALVLPSHGKPFRGIHERIDALKRHHEARLADAIEACKAKPHSARELIPVLFRRELDLHQLTFAMGEAIAHLNYLWLGGYLSRELCSDEVWRFSYLPH